MRRIQVDVPMRRMGVRGKACEIGLAEGLRFVYEGKFPGSGVEDTFCSGCGTLLIQRSGFSNHIVEMHDGRCDQCGVAPLLGYGAETYSFSRLPVFLWFPCAAWEPEENGQ